MIQTKLKTPTSSTDHLLEIEKPQPPPSLVPVAYTYQGPASINFSTWSERPKAQVSLMEDNDYKFKKETTTTSNRTPSKSFDKTPDADTTVKKPLSDFSTRFINHTTAIGYRRPFSSINKIDKAPRPHSIALDSNFDPNRLPIVRSVELKKPFADIPVNVSVDKYADTYNSSESLKEIDRLKPQTQSPCTCANKPVTRSNSFSENPKFPVVKTFRQTENSVENVPRSRKSWSVPKTMNGVNTVDNIVPFSRSNLKPIQSNKNVQNKSAFVAPPPPPLIKTSYSFPQQSNVDPREALLSSIRNFEGKKGLKSFKA